MLLISYNPLLQNLSESLKDSKGSLTAIRCDISKEEEILAMFEKIKKDLGGVDVCINNAGLSYNAPLLSGTTEQWRHMLDVSSLSFPYIYIHIVQEAIAN
jgi:NAD(P)-dependent dehydrogenase (short-subunit alcohol dehydrogenase family)